VEVKVLTELAVTRSIEQYIPKLDVVSKVDMAATMPFYPATLATAKFSGELFASACHGAAQVLPWLHQNHLAYCDPSPANVLVVGKKAVWNDFADVEQLGATLTAFRGTPAFTSLAMDRLAHGPAKDHAYTEQASKLRLVRRPPQTAAPMGRRYCKADALCETGLCPQPGRLVGPRARRRQDHHGQPVRCCLPQGRRHVFIRGRMGDAGTGTGARGDNGQPQNCVRQQHGDTVPPERHDPCPPL
jgi:hypothetical protein